MPCPHYKITIISRGKGSSAVAAAAYQSGERLYSDRDHRTKKYHKDVGEVVYSEVMLPSNAPPEFADRNILWNAVEEAEPNWNSQLAQRLVITLLIELSMKDNIALVTEHCRKEFFRKRNGCRSLCSRSHAAWTHARTERSKKKVRQGTSRERAGPGRCSERSAAKSTAEK